MAWQGLMKTDYNHMFVNNRFQLLVNEPISARINFQIRRLYWIRVPANIQREPHILFIEQGTKMKWFMCLKT